MLELKHLHLSSTATSYDFTGRGGGDKRRPPPIGDRAAHSQRLLQELDEAIDDLKELVRIQADYGVPKSIRGAMLTIIGRQDADLWLGDKKHTSGGMSLLAVSRRNSRGGSAQAIIRVSANSVSGLRERLEQYQDFQGQGHRLRDAWMFESMSSFRQTRAADFLFNAKKESLRTTNMWRVLVRDECAPAFRRSTLDFQAVIYNRTIDNLVEFAVSSSRLSDFDEIIHKTAGIVGLAPASAFNTAFMQNDPEHRREEIEAFSSSLSIAPDGAPRTVLLDTGVNWRNSLLQGSIDEIDCHSTVEDVPPIDDDGHGTKMAGVALFGDLAAHMAAGNGTSLTTALESVKIITPDADAGPAELIRSAVDVVERDDRPRVYCLAASVENERTDGIATDTAAEIDRLAWNDGESSRLFFVPTGNVPHELMGVHPVAPYRSANAEFQTTSPGQAFNAVCVGANTEKVSAGTATVAQRGDLAPTARTSLGWSQKGGLAYKPDIVMEGGNTAVDPDGLRARFTRDLFVMTTGHQSPNAEIDFVAETSAATAAAAGFATRLRAAYPQIRPETVRALVVHSARWSDTMRATANRLAASPGRPFGDDKRALLACFGWGRPDEEFAFRSAANALTLVTEGRLQALDGTKLGKMDYHLLPWPRQSLLTLAETRVELRVTLSYFIQPNEAYAMRNRMDRYASHRLRFSVQVGDEDHRDTRERVNAAIEPPELADDFDDPANDVHAASSSQDDDGKWWLGKNYRHRGSLHRDSWYGSARELAGRADGRKGVCVYPGRGWGTEQVSEINGLDVNYSLVVSILSPRSDVNLYTEVETFAASMNLLPNVTTV